MTEPTTFTRGLSIALMALLDAVMPSVIAVGLLYGLCALYGAEFKDFFVGLAIGFITKCSVDFSRRVVLTWAAVTPAVLIVVTLCLHELKRRLFYDPSSARRGGLPGCKQG